MMCRPENFIKIYHSENRAENSKKWSPFRRGKSLEKVINAKE